MTGRFLIVLTVALDLSAASWAAAQQTPHASSERHVRALSAERLEGRLAGSIGERLAADYLVDELKRLGARPMPGRTDFRLPFQFTAGTSDGGSSISIGSKAFGAPADVQALSFSDNGEVSGPAAFAGYGLVVPDGQGLGYDSYAGLDVKDKVVVVLRYFPEAADQTTRGILARFAGLRYKAMAARERGAKALLVVTGPKSANPGGLVPMTFDTAIAGSGIVAASASGAVADALFSRAGQTLEQIQQSLDSGNPHVAGFDLAEVMVTLRTTVVRERRTGLNVVGYLPATVGRSASKPWLALGAHYDHLGRGNHGNSLALDEGIGRIHFGADDNASGAAAVLAAGERLASEPRRRNVVLAFWSGEELGLIGSGAYVADPPVPLAELSAYLNFDMVGRMEDNKLTLQATGTSSLWGSLIERANVGAAFDLQLQADPHLPTDSASFNQGGVPTLNFFTGIHPDYHRPSDTADTIQYEDLDRVVDLAVTLARRVIDLEVPPDFAVVESPTPTGSRDGLRVFTGTIPDYSTEVKGLLLSGVVAGGPADQAGLRKGDIIVAIAGQAIANIYDYTYALEVLRIGQPVDVVFMREGERQETTLTPAARK